MGNVYSSVYYHLVWATKNRAPLVVPEVEPLLWDKIRRSCAEKDIRVHALNGMPDPVHLACSIPPALSVADAMALIKGSSAHFINHLKHKPHLTPEAARILYWQRGYGVHTFARRDLDDVVAYIQDQKQRHARSWLWPHAERTDEVPD